MASYGRDYHGRRGWFDRWFGGGGDSYDRGYRPSGGRGYDRSYGRGYASRGPRGYGAQYDAPRTRGWFNPGYMVDEAWGGAFARGDANYQGRRMYDDDFRTGRPGYSGGDDRPYRDDPGYGWRRPFGRGYDRNW